MPSLTTCSTFYYYFVCACVCVYFLLTNVRVRYSKRCSWLRWPSNGLIAVSYLCFLMRYGKTNKLQTSTNSFLPISKKTESSLFLRYYAEACKEWWVLIFTVSLLGNRASNSKEVLMLLCPIWPVRESNLKPSVLIAMSFTTAPNSQIFFFGLSVVCHS